MTTVQITLPDDLAFDAQQAGLLSSDSVEELLRERLRLRRADELFSAMDRMAAAGGSKAMSPEEVAEEIAVMRAERRARQGS